MPDPKLRSWPLYLGGLLAVAITAGGAIFLTARRGAALAQEGLDRRRVVALGPRVLVERVSLLPLYRKVALPGDVRGFQRATLYAKVSGYLREIRVDKGDLVKRGQLLGRLESPETDQLVAAAEADLGAKRLVAKRDRELLHRQLVSQQAVDLSTAAEKGAEATLRQAQALVAYEEIRAPFEGRITARYADPGALLQAATGSAASALPLVDLEEIDRIRIYVYLGQADAPFVRPTDPVEIVADDRPAQPLAATVTRLAGALDPRSRTMLCEVDLDNREARILPGSFVHVGLRLKGLVLPLVPNEALISRGDKLLVAIVRDGRAHFVPIEPGEDDGRTTQIRSGLVGGEWVALNVATGLEDGEAVQPVEPTGR
jgi:RND family efflux transporter MFP subunit